MPKVEISQNVHLLLSSFALSCEGEEVAALLLGKLNDGTVRISRACLLPRKQKKKDRVEVGDEDLSKGMQLAESLGLVVVGWFHSHPHITILPSHVDLKTQLQLQMLEKSFVGLIYGSFHENQRGSQRIQVLAFQAQDSAEGIKRIDIPIDVELRNQKAFKSSTYTSYRKPGLGNSASLKQLVIDQNSRPSSPLSSKQALVEIAHSPSSQILEGQISEEQSKREMIREAHLIDIANTFLQEELIAGEPKSGLEAIMSAARIAKIQSSLVDTLKFT